jgi:hypothetical protein
MLSAAKCGFCCNFVIETNVLVIYHCCILQLSLIGSNVKCFMVTGGGRAGVGVGVGGVYISLFSVLDFIHLLLFLLLVSRGE